MTEKAPRGTGKSRQKAERRERYIREKAAQKARENILKTTPLTDHAVGERQRAFCRKVINDILKDDAALSFSKPVTELWDVDELPGYFDKVKKPMDLGTILDNLQKDVFNNKEHGVFDVNLFRKDAGLVFKNALLYNSPGTELARLAKKFHSYLDRAMRELPWETAESERQAAAAAAEEARKEGAADSTDSEADKKYSSAEEDAKHDVERKPIKAKDKAASGDDESEQDDDPMDEDREDVKSKKSKSENSKELEDEIERLSAKIATLKKMKAKSEVQITDLDVETLGPMSPEERVKLRDEVEAAPWEKVDKVVQILQKYVDKAVADMGKGADPEYVTLELNDVEPHLLREVEQVVRPDPRRELETNKINKINEEVAELEAKLKSLKRSGGSLSSSRKKQKRRR